MNSKLLLHEAIAVVLLNKDNRTAAFEEIAKEINRRQLYVRKDGKPLPGYQVMQRAVLSKGQYHYLFERVDDARVRLSNITHNGNK